MRAFTLLLVVSVIAGCGDAPQATTTSKQPTADSDQTKPNSGDVVPASLDSASSTDDVEKAAQQADGSKTKTEAASGSTITQTSHEKSAEPKGGVGGKTQDVEKTKPEETEVIED